MDPWSISVSSKHWSSTRTNETLQPATPHPSTPCVMHAVTGRTRKVHHNYQSASSDPVQASGSIAGLEIRSDTSHGWTQMKASLTEQENKHCLLPRAYILLQRRGQVPPIVTVQISKFFSATKNSKNVF